MFVGISATSEKSLRSPAEETSTLDDHKPNSDETVGQDSVPPEDKGTENSLKKVDTVNEDGLVSEPISHNNESYGERAVEKVVESVEYSNIIGSSKQSNSVIQPDIEEDRVLESPTPDKTSPFEELKLSRVDDQTNSKIEEGKMQIKNLENPQIIDTEYLEPSSQVQSLTEELPSANTMQLASAVCPEKTENAVKDEKEEDEEAILNTVEQAKPKEMETLDNNSQQMISNLAPETSVDLNDITCLSASESSVDAGANGEVHLNSSTDDLSTVDSDVQLVVQDISPNNVLQVDLKASSVLSFTEPNEDNIDIKDVSLFDEDKIHVKDAPCSKVNGKRVMSVDGTVETKKTNETGEDAEEVSVIKQGATLVTVTETAEKQVAQDALSDKTGQGNKDEDDYDMLAETSQPEDSSAMSENNSGALSPIEVPGDLLAQDIPSTENVEDLLVFETSSGGEGKRLISYQTEQLLVMFVIKLL